MYYIYKIYTYIKQNLIHLLSFLYKTITFKKITKTNIQIHILDAKKSITSVDRYWSEHTVKYINFFTVWESKRYFEWLIKQYPLVDEFMDFYKDWTNKTILDYGCGTGNDLFRFLVVNNAKKVIGIDISFKALDIARKRLLIHSINPQRVELIAISNSNNFIPLEDDSIDHVNCAGVLQHTSNPQIILNEFFRVMEEKSTANIMVYNYNSIWLHLYTAYEKIVIHNKFKNMSIREAFSKNTDGENCPIARCYKPEQFMKICRSAGFNKVNFRGGYLSLTELNCLKKYGKEALEDDRLLKEHKNFLRCLTYDKNGYPKYKERYAGGSGVYKIYKCKI